MTRRRAFAFLSALLFCAILQQGASAVAETIENKSVTEKAQAEGCIECGYYRCPEDPGKCLLGSVPDPCGCCPGGLCARLLGEPCWNASIPLLSPNSRNDGYCARNYLCELRSDLQEEDAPEAICVCMEQSPACGSNNETYSTPCALHEEAMKLRNSSSLRLQHLGPCESRPWILSTLEDIASSFGQRVALNCEAKGFPVPDIFWEFHSADGRRVLKLPEEKHEATVHTSDGPEPLMRTSWMQLARLNKEHIGIYYCIANNSIGEASAASFVSMS
ncbi:insulin-like growth factor-binding protein-related protein 1 [Linepithema humile]|uniref:insulin-like growth factor-binding protein-related protein 1 n=1 Tax=Linepithema humile TaxID=83485 RepID=UPI00351F3DCE